MRSLVLLAGASLAALAPAEEAGAQEAARPVVLRATGCIIDARLTSPSSYFEGEIRVGDVRPRADVVVNGQHLTAFLLDRPLRPGDRVTIREGRTSSEAFVVASDQNALDLCGGAPPEAGDSRDPVSARLSVGWVVDTFAPGLWALSGAGAASGQPSSGETSGRWTAGAAFDLQVPKLKGRIGQVRIFGRAVYGLRPIDVDCTAEARPAICEPSTAGNASEQWPFIVKHATSLDARYGARLEFGPFPAGTFWASPYVFGRGGTIMFAGTTTDGISNPSIGAGLVITHGAFRNSYVEIGRGSSEMFRRPDGTNPWNRWKFDLHFTLDYSPGAIDAVTRGVRVRKLFRPYLAISVDTDNDLGTDNLQTYFGVDLALDALLPAAWWR
jgi:hypothetical protein